MVPGVAQIGQWHLEGVGDPAAALLGGARGARSGQFDDQTIAADRADRLDRQAVLASEQLAARRRSAGGS